MILFVIVGKFTMWNIHLMNMIPFIGNNDRFNKICVHSIYKKVHIHDENRNKNSKVNSMH